ncbi:MAG: lysine--tRNA ligase, partial [Spirochaetes bacterium]|nr:lysine--tRNA ligase [Spirochaetota bacterium]
MAEEQKNELQVRREKLEELRREGVIPYAERYERTHRISDVAGLADGVEGVSLAGRIVSCRHFGKLTFAHISDHTGRAQISLQVNDIGQEQERFKKYIDVGDYVGVAGSIYTTKTGEKTLRVARWTILSKSLRPLPEKFHGLVDTEQRLRKRYLELISSPESMARFKTRTL